MEIQRYSVALLARRTADKSTHVIPECEPIAQMVEVEDGPYVLFEAHAAKLAEMQKQRDGWAAVAGTNAGEAESLRQQLAGMQGKLDAKDAEIVQLRQENRRLLLAIRNGNSDAVYREYAQSFAPLAPPAPEQAKARTQGEQQGGTE